MSNIKHFFYSNNSLNKGYRSSFNSTRIKKTVSPINGLPNIDLLEEYENLYPGITEKIISMAEREQSHRHKKDTINAIDYSYSIKFARICVLVFLLVFSISLIVLAKINFFLASLFLFTISCIIFSAIFRIKSIDLIKNNTQ